jgi:hypothetical protein
MVECLPSKFNNFKALHSNPSTEEGEKKKKQRKEKKKR